MDSPSAASPRSAPSGQLRPGVPLVGSPRMPNDAFAAQALRAQLMREEDDDGTEEDEDDGESTDDDEGDPDPPAVVLKCSTCAVVLTERGMEVFLVSQPSTALFSTDIPSVAVRDTGQAHPIPTCASTPRRRARRPTLP